VFGEGIVNDAVAIILFETVNKFISADTKFTGITVFKILGEFLLLGCVSVTIGVVVGCLASFILKKMRFITTSSVKETLFIICFAYVCYTISLLLDMSGIISMLTCGIVMAQYGWYNLSPQGKHVSSVAV
jgi:NhaP-type Na+/H+ or K+/H+ antiporter